MRGEYLLPLPKSWRIVHGSIELSLRKGDIIRGGLLIREPTEGEARPDDLVVTEDGQYVWECDP